ncbi:two component transcriptional regulator, LuxR family [Ferrithrix thermotolerans DSM 19514]|uniref:Two component transcriptional regulator, LuxR family n=1 Tax=Ferrithrix thermotolerans DSM 19514 TaxID=1121881 RepID=A0A1M4SAD4_9ACTN|nr:response regulator transcription factor [Ferrithrix thermotolerans]SHE29105.1 two component transcriptional regulator, LuxR family [Ferrithrix thermotolerans DSM 19514]
MRIFVVDDHQVILDGLESMLKHFAPRVSIAGTAMSYSDALKGIEEHREAIDVVITDLRLKGDSGLDLCVEVGRRFQDLPVVFFTVYDDEQYLFQALRVGAKGYLLKQMGGEELVGHLERVASGEVVIDPAIAGRVALFAARLQSGEFWPGAHLGLTQRESEVLGLVVKGLSNRAVAQKLVLGEETVKTHLSSIYRKLDVKDRSQAVAVALREGVFH